MKEGSGKPVPPVSWDVLPASVALGGDCSSPVPGFPAVALQRVGQPVTPRDAFGSFT